MYIPVFMLQVGNCVARRNYRYFYLFLTTIAVTGVYMMACNITVIVLGRHGILRVLEYVCVWFCFVSQKPRGKWDLEMRSRPTLEDILIYLHFHFYTYFI